VRANKGVVVRKLPKERYTIGLHIKHPEISPDAITAGLGLTPQYSWRRGEPCRTPTGTELGGFRKETMWHHLTKEEGRRYFFESLRGFVDRLRPNRDFLAQLVSGGGRVTLLIHLAGDVNMGDDLEPETLRLMSELGIALSVEVFPKIK
jgi:hypothetical protein